MAHGASEAAILGIDLGTTEVKVGLVTLDGRLLGLARAGYRTETDAANGRAEQDPEAWWGALTTAVRHLVAPRAGRTSSRSPLDGHGPTLVAVDERGRPTRPAIIWQDTRATDEGGGAGRRPPGSRAGRWPGCRPRSGSSVTSPRLRRRRAGTSRRGTSSPFG